MFVGVCTDLQNETFSLKKNKSLRVNNIYVFLHGFTVDRKKKGPCELTMLVSFGMVLLIK